MPTRLTDCLMDPDNHAKLLSKTGLLSVMQNEALLGMHRRPGNPPCLQEKHLVLRAPSRRQLQKTLGSLRRIAFGAKPEGRLSDGLAVSEVGMSVGL